MFCKKLFCYITIHLVTINFQSCILYSVTFCIWRSDFTRGTKLQIETLDTHVFNITSLILDSRNKLISVLLLLLLLLLFTTLWCSG
jgi:hypothetical protein